MPMKRRARLVVSVASGIAAAMIALAYTSSVRAEAERVQREALAAYGEELVSVCVAARDIEPGESIGEGDVAVEEWVASLLPPDAALSLDQALGKVATSRIPRRAVVCGAYFEHRETGLEVPAGKVAVSVASDEEHAVGGAVGPGDMVDVYVSKDAISDRLGRCQILQTSSQAIEGRPMEWVTLAVDPVSVPDMLAATSLGPVTLVLPGSLDELDKEGA
ncbi:MAG: Flp pilus assembly protein CpaB [Collinsella sp.]|nr:Flp pilus assembly protein CpaB [Collinsella sp.]